MMKVRRIYPERFPDENAKAPYDLRCVLGSGEEVWKFVKDRNTCGAEAEKCIRDIYFEVVLQGVGCLGEPPRGQTDQLQTASGLVIHKSASCTNRVNCIN